MNKTHLFVGIGVLIAVLVGVGAGTLLIPKVQTAGDFPQGVQPSVVTTCSTTNGYCNPVGSFGFETSNGFWIGGGSQYNEQLGYGSASGTPATVFTLGALGLTSSTATTSVTDPNTAGLAIGDICSGGSNNTSTYVAGCSLTSTNGVTGTVLVAYTNLTAANLSVPTSTVFRVSFEHLPY